MTVSYAIPPTNPVREAGGAAAAALTDQEATVKALAPVSLAHQDFAPYRSRPLGSRETNAQDLARRLGVKLTAR